MTANVTQSVDDLRKEFKSGPGGLLISSAPVVSALAGGGAESYPGCGGVFGWNYQNALDPRGWAESVSGAITANAEKSGTEHDTA